MRMNWNQRAKVFVQRLWQPTSACMTCMPGSWGNLMSGVHWIAALQTGLLTGALAIALTFTPAARLYGNRYGNALVVGSLTALGDAYSHASSEGIRVLEAVLTGVVSGLLALAASYVLEDRARRIRALWGKVVG